MTIKNKYTRLGIMHAKLFKKAPKGYNHAEYLLNLHKTLFDTGFCVKIVKICAFIPKMREKR